MSRLHEKAKDPNAFQKGLEELVDGYRRFNSILKTLVLHPDEAKPRPGAESGKPDRNEKDRSERTSTEEKERL